MRIKRRKGEEREKKREKGRGEKCSATFIHQSVHTHEPEKGETKRG